MSGNPEFRRHLWLELTPYRLAGIPLLLAGIFYIAYLSDSSRFGGTVETAAVVIFLGLTFLWGNRQATESVIIEIRDRTWDWQRMSSIDPWSLSWGKLFGSTICTWYGGAFCLAAYFAASNDPASDSIRMMAMLLLGAVLCQAAGLLASLQLIVIKERGYSRSFSSGFILLSLLILPAIIPQMTNKSYFFWYGSEYSKTDFIIGSLLCFDSWLFAGIYCLVREEFKFRTFPVAWPAFTLFMMIYAAGFTGNFPEKGALFPSRLLVAFAVACGLTYLAILAERKDPVAYRRMIKEVKDRRWMRLMEKAPRWALSVPFVVVTAIFLVLSSLGAGEEAVRLSPWLITAVVAFLGRDLALFNFFNLGERTKRADMLVILWLLILYGLVPGIFRLLKAETAAALFWPHMDYALLSCAAALCQMFAAWWMTLARWKNKHSII
jgi:hypothetical protein